jgi:hypothetical protein
MNRKQRDASRERIRQIEITEAQARCAYCKRAFKESRLIVESPLNGRKFCSVECLQEATEVTP